ncbi:MAG: hypothetical protein ABEJ24_02575 [Candidatus Magasanikbacteria bacterium]
MVKISDEHYEAGREPQQEFGFYTLDLSGVVSDLKNSISSLEDFMFEKSV